MESDTENDLWIKREDCVDNWRKLELGNLVSWRLTQITSHEVWLFDNCGQQFYRGKCWN